MDKIEEDYLNASKAHREALEKYDLLQLQLVRAKRKVDEAQEAKDGLLAKLSDSPQKGTPITVSLEGSNAAGLMDYASKDGTVKLVLQVQQPEANEADDSSIDVMPKKPIAPAGMAEELGVKAAKREHKRMSLAVGAELQSSVSRLEHKAEISSMQQDLKAAVAQNEHKKMVGSLKGPGGELQVGLAKRDHKRKSQMLHVDLHASFGKNEHQEDSERMHEDLLVAVAKKDHKRKSAMMLTALPKDFADIDDEDDEANQGKVLSSRVHDDMLTAVARKDHKRKSAMVLSGLPKNFADIDDDDSKHEKVNIIIAGAPASGKGTQCEIIKEEFGVVHLSTGDMLRAAVKAGTDVGKKAKEFMDSGKLVPDEVIIGIVKDRLAQEDCKLRGWLLDGFPRTQAQAKAMEDAGIVADCFIFLDVPGEVLVERVVGRRTDPATGKIYHMKFSPPEDDQVASRLTQRSDDTEEKVKVRLEQFHANVDAVKGSYTDIMVSIDGNRAKGDVSNEVVNSIKSKIAEKKIDIIVGQEKTASKGSKEKSSFARVDMLGEVNTAFPDDGVWLRIIHVNDVYELDNFPYFKTLVDEYKDCDAGKVMVFMGGDFIAPSLLSGLDKGRGMVDTMNKCDITHVCFGNHETDVPMPALVSRIEESKFAWINTNMREFDTKLNVKTDPHEVFEVKSKNGKHSKKLGLLGLLTEDPSVYRPGSFGGATIEPVMETTKKYMKEVMDPMNLDLVVPMTHCRMGPDREFCKTFGEVFPIVLGAHDHEPYDETHNGSRVIKTGMDGHLTAIVDIKWNSSKDAKPEITAEMIKTQQFEPNKEILKVVQGHKRILDELQAARLFKLSNWLHGEDTVFSTKNNRLFPSTGSKALCSMFRMGMRAECGMCNSGAIRAGKEYPKEHEWFTWSDLKAEVPFRTEFTTVKMPGKVLDEAIRYSRRLARQDPPASSGGYLQCCDKIEMDEEKCTIQKIGGEPFDPERSYLLALPIDIIRGIDNHIPILEWVATAPPGCCSANDEGKPAKIVLVEMFSAMMWLDMGKFKDIDENGDGVLTHEEVRARAQEVFGEAVADLVADNIFHVADINHKGYITPVDMMVIEYAAHDMQEHVGTDDEIGAMQQVASHVLGKRASSIDVQNVLLEMADVLDADASGSIDRGEVMNAIGKISRQSILQ